MTIQKQLITYQPLTIKCCNWFKDETRKQRLFYIWVNSSTQKYVLFSECNFAQQWEYLCFVFWIISVDSHYQSFIFLYFVQSVETHSSVRNSDQTHSYVRQSVQTHSSCRQSVETHSSVRNSDQTHSYFRQSVQTHSSGRQSVETQSSDRNFFQTEVLCLSRSSACSNATCKKEIAIQSPKNI